MPRRKWIDRSDPSTQTYRLLYRPQDDPNLHDEAAGDRALFAVPNTDSQSPSSASSRTQAKSVTGIHLSELEEEGDVDLESMRENEGEAAEYGIFFDDSNYDYMQHLRSIGQGGGDSHFVDAVSAATKGRGKGNIKGLPLDQALRHVNLDSETSQTHMDEDDEYRQMKAMMAGAGSSVGRGEKTRRLEAQQEIPDEIAGFQPDMDPRLREVLEALDNEAYVDNEDQEDIFGELGRYGKSDGEIDLSEFELGEDEDDGWESDATEKASEQPDTVRPVRMPVDEWLQTDVPGGLGQEPPVGELPAPHAEAAVAEDGDWLRDFAKHKEDKGVSKRVGHPSINEASVTPSGAQGRAPSLYTLHGTPLRQKKRKGAATNPSAYSMTSSSLARTDGQQLLDARFDQIERLYALDEADDDGDLDGGASEVSGMTGRSKLSVLSSVSFADEGAVRTDLDGMMDDFLGDWNKANPGGRRRGAKGKRGKNGNERYGLAQLDEIRGELGRGRISANVPRA